MANSRLSRNCLLVFLLLVCAVNFCWFSLSTQLTTEAPLRIVLGALFLFLVPGLIWGEVLRWRARHVWETCAIAFTLSLLIEIVLLPIPFVFQAPIELWIGLLFAVTLPGLGLLALPQHRNRPWLFLAPLLCWPRRSFLSWCVLLFPLAMAGWAYVAGEALFDICGEKMLHMMFVRYYHDMPLSLLDLGVRPGMAPPNLVNLWEFLIAGWARMIHVDPLLVFFRARFVVPVLGLAGLYLLLRMIFVRRRKVEAIFFAVVLMCLSNLLFAAPTLKWVPDSDPTRGIFGFMGTVHHADPAIDILLALSCGLGLQMIRRPSLSNAALFATILTANFLWHPREFLQIALYLGILGVAIVTLPSLRHWRIVRNWGMATGLLVTLAVVLLFLSTKIISQKSHAYDEVKIKKTALAYAALPENVMGVRSFFHIPYIMMISKVTETENVLSWEKLKKDTLEPSWQLDLWLMLSGLGLVVLGFFGRREDRALALHYFWLWLLALAWNFSMLVIFALTYSEFFMVTQRLLYLFGFIVIADFLLLTPGLLAGIKWPARLRLSGSWPALLVACGALGFGAMLWYWQRRGAPGAMPLSLILTGLMWAAAAWMLMDRRERWAVAKRRSPFAVGLLVFLFFAPFLGERVHKTLRQHQVVQRPQPEWFSDQNPFDLSAQLITWVRTLPPGQMFLVPPDGRACIHAYAPHYEAILPVTTLLPDQAVRHDIAVGAHPLLFKDFSPGLHAVDHGKAQDWLRAHGVRYLLLNHEYYDSYLRDYVAAHPSVYQIAFDNPAWREMVVRYASFP